MDGLTVAEMVGFLIAVFGAGSVGAIYAVKKLKRLIAQGMNKYDAFNEVQDEMRIGQD
jgi:hypothetical protein